MDAQRREDITGWDAREFSGGFDGLREHVGGGFSGAATDGTGWLFLLDGRVIGVVDAELDAFSDASGTVYEAPHQALPVLFAMQELGGEQRAQYYTNDTSLAEADRKLSQGGFTGYVELTENVLSGDYYVAYTAGESMAAAYVGNSRRLETGEKAFDLADDEVGIYTVYEVDLDVRTLPEGTGASEADGSDEPTESSRSSDPSDSGVPAESDGPNESNEPAKSNGPAEPSVASEAEKSDPSEDGASAGTRTDDATETTPHASRAEDHEPDPATAVSGNRASDSSNGTPPRASEGGTRRESPETPKQSVSETHDPDSGAAESSPSESSPAESNPAEPSTRMDDSNAEPPDADAGSADASAESDQRTASGSRTAGDVPDDEDVFSEEAQWRETKSIPALDPSETNVRGAKDGQSDRNGVEARSRGRSATGRGRSGGESKRKADHDAADRSRSGPSGSNASATAEESPDPRPAPSNPGQAAVSRSEGEAANGVRERIEQLEAELAEAKSERESIATERDTLREERDSLTRERDELESERDRLESEVEELRAEIQRLRTNLTEAESKLPDSDHSLPVAEAREGTNLFIRYESKGGATLEDAHDGNVGRDELRENLRIEHHTSFETDGLTVDGRPFEEFLGDTMEYGFTRWLVEDLPFEVGETGNGSALRDLYDALPEIDRAEIGGSVSIVAAESGNEDREQQAFDLVLRDRMGNPLFVADLNDSRAPTKGASLESLVANGGRIAESNDGFAGAFAVTASFFDPDALEVASDAVGGGLFGRSKRKSFVKLSRKRGYHLCLVESREGGFHLTVPDL